MIHLNKEHSVEDQLKFIEGTGGLPFISINNKSAKALISLFGGQVISYQPTGVYKDLLFLSKKAKYNGEKAIRGGIPVCWPWFGQDAGNMNRASHGFARNSMWSVIQTVSETDFVTKVKLRLIQTSKNRPDWPQLSELELDITIANTLTLELISRNTGDQPILITQAFHSYYQIGDIDHVQVSGLENNYYLDKLDDGAQKKQYGTLAVSKEIDRIYTEVQNLLIIDDPIINRRIRIESAGSSSAVIWNPWINKSALMDDLEENDYKHFLCVETANVDTDAVEVLPGSEHRLKLNVKIQSGVIL